MAKKSKRIASADSNPVLPVRMGDPKGSGSQIGADRRKFFAAGHPQPVALRLRLSPPVQDGIVAAHYQVNQPTLLIHAQDPNFSCCWFSRAIDLEETDNPAFWMLQKTASDTWFLCLRRASGELAAYNLKTKKHSFPITLKKGRVGKEFKKWPLTVTISPAA
jgi:hypothetical protein